MSRPPRTAGALRHVVQIVAPQESPDGFGGVTQTPTVLYRSHAAVRPLSGLELERARQTQADATTMVTMRYRPGVSPKMHVVYQGRRLDIVASLNEDERNEWLDLLCHEVPNGG